MSLKAKNKSMITITIIIGIILFISYQIPSIKSNINNSIPKILLNGRLTKNFDTYTYLSENKTESENYKILKLTDRSPRIILFDKVSENFILTGDELYLTTIKKINNKGEEIDSLKVKGHLYPSGVYFYKDYVIDWAITGNKSKQKYDTIINYDTLSKKEFKNYLSRADIIDFTKRYKNLENFKGRCHLKIQDKWIVIESKKMFEKLERDYKKDYFEIRHKNKDFSKKNGNRLIPLKNSIAPFYDWEKQNNTIFIQKFVKESYFSPQLFLGGNAGWRGAGYFQLTHKAETLNFKSYAFKPSKRFFSLDPEISIYHPDKEYNINIAFIKLGHQPRSNRHFSESGIYVLKSK